jgi:hypothetical protein
MGILNNYLSFLPMFFNSPMAIEGTKKGNVLFDEADLAGIILNSVPVSWMSQYNMMHATLPDGTRTLLQDLESIKPSWKRGMRLVKRQRQMKQLLLQLLREVPRSVLPLGIPVNESQRTASLTSSAGTARQRVGPIRLATPSSVAGMMGWAVLWPRPLVSLVMGSSHLRRQATSRWLT